MPMFNKRPTFFRYLPISPDDRPWGLFVTTAGYSRSHPESAGYPPDKHPSAYHFECAQDRVLDEFQIVHIVRGEGTFESATHGKVKIKRSEALLLFPGDWRLAVHGGNWIKKPHFKTPEKETNHQPLEKNERVGFRFSQILPQNC
jgi:hypothetical protein